jgi:ATP-dependent RNA helicase DeaD
MNLEKFKELGLSEAMLKEIKKKGFDEPTEIQEKIIPMLLGGDMDVVGQAQTGTGKTAAFGIPIIEKMEKRTGSVQALVLVPTRELALQVAEELDSLKGKKKLSILAVYGGQSIREQIRELQSGVDIVIGTPGRIQDHINRKTIALSHINILVLDEADEMLNMGFVDEVELILKETNPGRRTLLFSATMPDSIMKIAKKYMKAYEIVATDRQQVTTNLTDQIYFEVSASDKLEVLCRIMDLEPDFYGLVFCRTKVDTDELVNKLIERGYGADGIHGDLSQTQRERTLDKFKRKRITILVATDVAARGIDVTNMTHVINYARPRTLRSMCTASAEVAQATRARPSPSSLPMNTAS